MEWDSKQYLKYAEERKQPCLDLLAMTDGEFNRILDLGCGPGNSTENLKAKYSRAEITGLDADDNMLQKARKDHPDIDFVKGFAPNDFDKLTGKFDLVFSNACIHWIPEQEKLIAGVYELLNENGMFAVQIPLTDEARFYRLMYRLIDRKWGKLKAIRNFHNLDARGYYNALSKHFKNIGMRQCSYYHTVKRCEVLEWYKGSGLRPYLDALGEAERTDFLKDLQKEIDAEYGLLDDGNVFLIMPRLFFTATK